jgi:parallel beta-helix repeat protein
MVTGNAFEMNSGPGIWCDIDCSNVTIADNVVHHNLGVGIAFEISDGAEITGNRVWENGWGSAQRPWAYEAGILVASSSNAHVHHNVVAWNGDGIAVISQCRAHLADGRTCDLAHPWNAVRGNTVHDNAIIMADDPMAPYNVFPLAWARDIEDAAGSAYRFMFSPEAGNEGYDNRYWLPQPEGSTKIGFSWGDSNTASLSAFNVTPGEERGTYLSDTERDQILTGAGMPMAPERHDAPVESYPPMPPG